MRTYVASTYSYLWRLSLDGAIADIAAAGFRAVEVLAAPPHVDLSDGGESARRLVRACRREGVRVNSVVPSGVDVNLASTDADMRAWSVAQFTAAARIAARAGACHVLVHPGRRHPLRPPPLDLLRGWVIDGVSQVVDAASAEGVGVLLENTPTGLLDTAKECLDVVAEVGSPGIALCYDVANGHMVEDVGQGLRTAGRHLGLVHLSDTTRSAWSHDPIGRGDVPFAAAAEAAEALCYEAEVVLETLHDGDIAAGFRADLAALSMAGWDVSAP